MSTEWVGTQINDFCGMGIVLYEYYILYKYLYEYYIVYEQYMDILHIFGCMQDSYVRQKDDFVVFIGLRRYG